MSKQKVTHINGERYEAVVCSIDSTDETGRPRTLTVRRDDESMDVTKINHFLIVFIKSDCLGKKD